MKHHLAHFDSIIVSVGQTVVKGQQIGTFGDTGTEDVHCHWEIQKVFRTYSAYTQGLSRDKVLEYYQEPKDIQTVSPGSYIGGWEWLSRINAEGQLHPGVDISHGAGDSERYMPIYSPCNGKVIFTGQSNGWGKHIFIEQGETMAGQLYDQSGQVWLSYNNKKFYVEAPQEFGTEPIIKGEAPGVVMIKQSDQDTRLAEQKAEYEAKLKELSTALSTAETQRDDLRIANGELLGKNSELDKLNNTLIDASDKYRMETENQLKDLSKALEKCQANLVAPEKGLIGQIIDFINKIIGVK